ncbi:Replication initiation and membrane attachment [Thermosyntropha lipolytica DSM 11003]|uniref:Replication initiation and membrane attachment n=1 Tax=Thermosyntropha lipolytica DSM 11003 TaxID=1123382 RepID=A0A1M5L7D0_9FIRM|nr:DnaD domain protein [Thermosyntropha lipolytica]SHG60911.1 Replication initiation and membrane attachment [Thermosyntropha lipolytica DSM 11003]
MDKCAALEMMRWGYACIPGVIFSYSKELDLDMEDIGVLSAIFYAIENSKPLYRTGITAGQVLNVCPSLSKQKLAKKISRLSKMKLIEIKDDKAAFNDKEIYLEPLMAKIEALIWRDHPELFPAANDRNQLIEMETLIKNYEEKIRSLEAELEEKRAVVPADINTLDHENDNYKKVADFIARKTGNLLSVKMSNELKKWLYELGFTPEFLLCMLELCFERNIYNPREITRIARDLKEYSINTVEGMGLYFEKYVDLEKNMAIRMKQFDPEIMEFGNFTGIDMTAEARKRIYYKWRYDWGFSHAMIMKAGEIMCQRTKNGGLEYIDSVLSNWLRKEIRTVEDAEKEIRDFKAKNKNEKTSAKGEKKSRLDTEYEIYIPPSTLEQLKSKV